MANSAPTGKFFPADVLQARKDLLAQPGAAEKPFHGSRSYWANHGRRHAALDLYCQGRSLAEINTALYHFAHPGSVWYHLQKAFSELQATDSKILIQAHVARLANLYALFEEKLHTRRKPAEKTASLLLKIMDREARLLGLDKPVKTDVTTGGQPIKLILIDEEKMFGPVELKPTEVSPTSPTEASPIAPIPLTEAPVVPKSA